ncbi:3-oxoacyl-[acyl-carrier-protein] reductase [Clostridium frigidicarnis]|uniref:3-oxoacyl-[acyl-carrier-protein] reductase n=1 Tax=Clostridium frigidicarnis TaxID=84698 RepID=A0A1I0VNR0_9CLOT|nr:3-oxoacyl-[acyl-carrier-protein] reductase [Clostridium frigidicarnis]SFA77246.1 3-oxoacyl-[acyl-carrier-protein] reductase [Clostridium frigidicarnis]
MEIRCALITGGSRGIGKAICLKLAKLGYKIALNYRSDEAGAIEVVNLIKNNGGEAIAIKGDVSNYEDALNVIEKTKEIYGTIDVLVNNAGITNDKLILRMKEEDFDKVINVNLKGTFNCVKHVVPLMLKNKRGVIINLSSVIGIIGNAGQSNYAASKAGIIGLTKSLAKELGGKGIRVNAIAPGFIKTDMTEALSETVKEKLKDSIPLKRLGDGEDIAEVVSFLCSDGASYITGQVINVDGGMVM